MTFDMSTKTIFMLVVAVLTLVITIASIVQSMDSLAYALSGKLDSMTWITPCVGLVICMLINLMPDDKGKDQ